MRVHVTYDKISHRGEKIVRCMDCGKRMKRAKTFSMTENPWNRNPDGSVRSHSEIYAALVEEAKAWEAVEELEMCNPCLLSKS